MLRLAHAKADAIRAKLQAAAGVAVQPLDGLLVTCDQVAEEKEGCWLRGSCLMIALLCMLPETCSCSASLPASQVVLHEGQILEKPEDEAEASMCTMILALLHNNVASTATVSGCLPCCHLTGAALHCRVRACARFHSRVCSAD